MKIFPIHESGDNILINKGIELHIKKKYFSKAETNIY